MGDTNLDSLNIRLTASAGDAVRAVDSIISALTRLNGALNNFSSDSKYMRGLNNLSAGLKSVRISLNGLDPNKIKEVATALGRLSSAGEKLSALNGVAPKIDRGGMEKIVSASDKAIAKAKEIGGSWNFGDEEGVNRLAEAIERLYGAVGDDDAVRSSMNEIENLIETYSRFENELHEVAQAENEAIRSTHGRLNSDWMDVLGGDYETARRNRGKLGISNTSRQGASANNIIAENSQLGIEESINETENLALALERLEKNAYNASHEMVGFHEASETLTGGLEAIQAEVDDLVSSLGLAVDKLREAQTVDTDDFMHIADDGDFVNVFGDPSDDIDRLRDSAQQASPAVEALSTAESHVADQSQRIEEVGNIFGGIANALQSLQGITLSDSLKNITFIKDAIGKFGGDPATRAAANIRSIGDALSNFHVEVPTNGEELISFANALGKFGGKSQGRTAENLIQIQAALSMFKGMTIDEGTVRTIQMLGDGLYKFGLAKMEKAMMNIPQLAQGMQQLIASLANVPQVSENTIRLVTALGNMNVSGNQLSSAIGGVNTGLKRYHGHAMSARKASMSLASAFGRMYANFFIFFRLINRFKKDIDLASALTEVQNVVDVTFTDMADKMNDFSKSAIDALGMSELTAKQIGSRFQAMGRAMNISPAMVKSTNDFVQSATAGYADVADSMADVSINLTRLAGDMASFYNTEYADVAKDLEAVMTGMTRPLRKYGLDLTVATLEEWAMRNGMEANMKTMTQAEKTLLRYQYVMANTTAAHGDFIRTQETWANQVRLATERLNQLRIVLGKIAIYTFKPLVQSFNNAMKQIIKGAEGLLNSLGKIFGWQIEWSDAGILGEESDDAEDLADNMGDAADNAKKFKNFLLGIDELNLLPDNSDKDKGAGSGLGDLAGELGELGGFNIKPIEKGFESLYDTLYKLGNRINEIVGNLIDSIDWDKVYKKARRFGRDMGEFINGLLANSETFYKIGKLFAGGINAIAYSLDSFHKELNGYKLGVDIGSLFNGFMENLDWDIIKSAAYEKAHDLAQTINGAFFTIKWENVGKTLAEGLNTAFTYLYTLGSEINWTLIGNSISEGINGFFDTFDFELAASTINAWATGILDGIYEALDKVNWNQVGKKIGEFLKKLNVQKIASGLAKVMVKVFAAAADVLASSFAEAPMETALLASIAVIRPQNIGIALSTLFKSATGYMDKKAITDGINGLLSKLPISLPKLTLGAGAGLTEFIAIKDTFKDLYMGAESVGGALTKIGTTALATGGIMTAVFGFPAGTIAAGLIAVGGEIVGIIQGLGELQKEADKMELGSILSNDGVSLGTFFGNAANDMRSAYENYGKMAREIEKTDFSGLKENIQTDMQEIGFAIETLGTNLGDTSKTVEQKLADLEKLFENFKNNISKLFSEEISVIEQAGMNGLIDNVAQTTAMAHNLDLGVQKQIDEIKAKMDEAQRLFEENGKNGVMTFSYEEYQGIMQNYWNQLNAIYSAVANSGMEKIAETASNIDFSKFFLGEENIDGVQASLEEFGTIYNNAISDLETSYDGLYEALRTLGEQASALGDDPAALEFAKGIQNAQEKEAKLIQEANANYISKIEEIEKQAWSQIGVILSNPEHLSPQDVQNQVDNYVNSVLIPLEKAISTETENVGITWGSSISNLASQLQDEMNSSLGGMAVEGGKLYGTDLFGLWKERFADATLVAEKSINNLASTQSVASKQAEEYAKSQGLLSKVIKLSNDNVSDTEKSAQTSAYAYGNVDRAMGDTLQSSVLLKGGITDVNNVLKDTSKSGEGLKEVSNSFSGLGTMLGNFGTALLPVKTGFSEFTTQAQMGMTNTSQIFGQSFNSIMKSGNQTIAWLKGSFVPYFSSGYWNSITQSIPNAFGNAFRQAINIMTNLWKQFAQWANENMKMNVKTNGKNQADIKVEIPKYATGGFPDEDGMFMANHGELVGQFSNGKTAVANNEQIVEGIRQGVYEAVSAAMQGGGQGVTVELIGDASDIFTAVVKENNRTIMRTGSSPIRN